MQIAFASARKIRWQHNLSQILLTPVASARRRQKLLIQSPSAVGESARCRGVADVSGYPETRLHGASRSTCWMPSPSFFPYLLAPMKTLQQKSSSIIRSAMNKKRMGAAEKNEKGINGFSPPNCDELSARSGTGSTMGKMLFSI